MKLIRAKFTNFRLLSNLVLDFSTDTERKLTVIRAENESGKTTILTGIQWALYGDSALPGGRKQYRLHPIDWDTSGNKRVTIAVEVEFETTSTRQTRSGGQIETTQRFRILRSTYDVIQNDGWDPGPGSVQLFEIKSTGSREVEPPEAHIQDKLPRELREIFFTDGDRALSFIQADVSASTKQARVRSAIQSLLGLDVIKSTQDRVKRVAAAANKKARNIMPDAELAEIVDTLSDLQDEALTLEENIRNSEEQFANFDELFVDIDRKIQDSLIKGDREELQREISHARTRIQTLDAQQEETQKAHANLFKSMALPRDLAHPALVSSLERLEDLRDQGKIPNTSIPVLEERLTSPKCICGEQLQGKNADALRRKDHIQQLIEDSRRADAMQTKITELFYGSLSLQIGQTTADQTWNTHLATAWKRRDQIDKLRGEAGLQLKALEAKVAHIPDNDIQGLRESKRQFAQQRDKFNSDGARYRADLGNVRQKLSEKSKERDQFLRQQKKGNRIMADLEVAQDIETILKNAYRRLTTEELEKVSSRMNEIFLEMIGADPQQNAIIQRTMISSQFEIVVYGPNDRALNPDRDLNGASRRALTLAFILALTKVSEVEAPNAIDTPLGMMSGFVKRSVLKTVIRESSQPVLFLTRSEISGCEDILDTEAGHVSTLTNPAHYPVMLINDPVVGERTILKCSCSHREECTLCQRRTDTTTEETLPT